MLWSLSARRAWIEIAGVGFLNTLGGSVALRKESVDRNSTALASMRVFITSLSARRAWIEIEDWLNAGSLSRVALRKESVDRNMAFCVDYLKSTCRSPQGERG